MEVRCCCDAHLIGYMDGDEFKEGEKYEFPVGGDSLPTDPQAREHTEHLTLEAARVSKPDAHIAEIIPGMVAIEITEQTHVALKSRDYPIEKLRQIPGFREATIEEREADPSRGDVIRMSRDEMLNRLCNSRKWTEV